MTSNDFTTYNNLFTSDFCRVQDKHFPRKSFIVSPLSVQIILGLIKLGAKDATRHEIQKATHLPGTEEDVRKAINECFKSLTVNNATLHIANKVYIRESLAIKDDFKRIAVDLFRAEVEGINFSKNTEAAQTINKWVEKKTENKIRNLIDPKSITGGTSAVLVNALYFQASWLHAFGEPTKDADFHLNAKDKVRVPTMHTTRSYYYYDHPSLKAKFLRMPMKCSSAFFVIVLPDAKDGLAALEKQPNVFSKRTYQSAEIKLSLPKFKIETSLELSEQLKDLGIKTLFTGVVDLSGIAGNQGELVVGSVVQKVFINVDERGIEAAAATGLDVGERKGQVQKPIPLVVDHPFIFFIAVNDIVVLAGRVLDPRQ